MKNKRGFTLIELMAVVVIISLIAILTFPNIINQVNKSKDANKSNINSVVIAAAKRYVADNPSEFEENEYCLSIDTLVSNDYVKEDIFKDSDILNKKVIKLATEKSKYEIMDKDKCKVNNCKYDYCDEEGDGYTEIPFIESIDGQYIDMELTLSNKNKVEISYVLNGYGSIFGAQQNGNGFTINIGSESNSRWGSYSYVPYYDTNFDKDFQEQHNIVYSKDGFYQDGVLLNTPTQNEFETPNNGYLFRANGAANIAKSKIYSAKLYEDDVLIRDYVPAVDNENHPCLYDKIEKKCYYNQGTGEFLWG